MVNRPQPRSGRGNDTRELIMTVAERLYAEHGLSNVSNRQISEAAGQGNNTAVSYHFGSKTTLVRAIMTKHGTLVDAIRQRHVAAAGDSTDVRDWVRCLVRPVPEHLATLGVPSWQARFAVQVMTDPLMRALVTDESLARDSLRHTLHRLGECLADTVPPGVRRERGEMARHLITHTCAERERSLAEGSFEPDTSWERTADALEDALVGLLTAPTTRHRTAAGRRLGPAEPTTPMKPAKETA
ncbi:TetR/AcrR family transcriptional regulator [Streptomyces sp. MW-W600-10]|uniref:TetR/AcrR family transcriptional regulator n=1 Tax=Streptomyces sp. MW-W600-10 TaxID=2829819 RepID=UPI001C46D0F2|nr:TetR/AcrR family transcriptional regulator [Streptomyces sp. MW-W600-10]MBV7244635.1 TetR/AcrR family transcriptional regulator [Streptomyces sp. MW-W600-10]